VLLVVSGRQKIIYNLPLILGGLLIFMLPILILFIQYFLNDRHSTFKFDKTNNIISYKKKEKKLNYSIDSLKLIELNCTPARLKKGNIGSLWQDDFFYYRFVFTDDKSIEVTSFILNWKMINEVNFKDLNFSKKSRFFPFL